ncbi:hypothetical protein [Streptomyces sp. NPDC089799]
MAHVRAVSCRCLAIFFETFAARARAFRYPAVSGRFFGVRRRAICRW